MTADLGDLLARVAQKDTAAFSALYDQTCAQVYGMVSRVLRDPGYSEETMQEIYLQVWRTADRYDRSAGTAIGWLLTVAHRRAVDRVRAEEAAGARDVRWTVANLDPARDVVADAAIVRDERRRVVDCLGALTALQRETVELAYYRGLTYPQVSEQLSANVGTVKTRMRDALRGLRNCLGGT